jgi:sulfur carrier protein ThiS
MDLLRSLGLAPDAHLVVRGDTPIPLDEPLADGERLRILTAVSGGVSGRSGSRPKL